MLAIIPARGGSKRLPRKNIKNLFGKPLIQWTIESALRSIHLSNVLVSTEDFEIAEIAKKCGAQVPFLRPMHLSEDHSKSLDVFRYTINRLEEENQKNIETFVVLQPTSPLRRTFDIDSAIDIFYQKKAKAVVSVVELEHSLGWTLMIDGNGILKPYFDESFLSKNRQGNKTYYRPNGAVYVLNTTIIKQGDNIYTSDTYPYCMQKKHSVDIDDQDDFDYAEFLMKKNNNIFD